MNQRGFTLTELLVSLALLGMILGGVYTLQSQGLYSYLMGAAKVEVQQSARGAVDLMIRELRSATSVTAISASDVTFVDQNGATIRYNLTSGSLQRTFNATVDVLAESVQNLAFTYQDSSGTTTTVAGNVATIIIGLTTQQLQNPCSSTPTTQQQMVVQDQVRLRNML
jgi:prepilin-type N-terminal cleavage/methylation domain-containing protein